MKFSNSQQEYKTLDNYCHLNQLIIGWAKKFVDDKNSIHVAISRKAPRLLEWGLDGVVGDGVNVVTELALPFVDWKKEDRCLLVDEAIYHGTTFEKVLNLLEQVNTDWTQLIAMPLVVTTEALRSHKIESRLSLGMKIIDLREIPFFIDTIIAKFFELGKPYDIEYPLFYIDLNTDVTKEDMLGMLDDLAHIESKKHHIERTNIDFYSTENYSREKNKNFYSFTYCTDYLYSSTGYGKAKPDFSKLRFFVKGKRLCVASMSPYIIPEQCITQTSNLFEGDLRLIWKALYEVAINNRIKVNTQLSQDKEYEYQWKKSMVMTANYLLSFNHFLKVRNSLLAALGNKVVKASFNQSESDLCYLFGKDLAKKLMDVLGLLEFGEDFSNNFTLMPTVRSVIPADYSQSYNFQIGVDNLRKGQTESISFMLSSMFSSMHWLVEIQSRMSANHDYGRLRFGESFDSMIERILSTTRFSREELQHGIHRGVDQRIDRGSVVPNYVKVHEAGTMYWMRLFRSGENEDILKDQLLRIILKIVHSYYDYVGQRFMTRGALECIFSIFYFLEKKEKTLQNKIKVEFKQKLFGLEMIPTYCLKSLMYVMKVQVDKQKVGLLDYAIDNNVLSIDEFGYVVTANSSYFEKLSTGVPLDAEMQVVINKVVAFVASKEKVGARFALQELNQLYEFDPFLSLARLREDVYTKIMSFLGRTECDANLMSTVNQATVKLLMRTYGLSSEQYEECLVYYAVFNIWKYACNHASRIDESLEEMFYSSLVSYSKAKGKKMYDGNGCYNWLCMMKSLENICSLPQIELRERLMDIVK